MNEKLNEDERRKQILLLERSKKLLFDKIRVNNELVNLMMSKPKKLKPEYEFETDPAYYEVLKQKWRVDVELENERLRQNIKQLDSQIDYYKSLKNKKEEKKQDVNKEKKKNKKEKIEG